MVKRTILVGFLVVGSASSAFAQTPFSWSGFYAGVYGGWGAGKSDVITTQEGVGYFNPGSTDAINDAGTFQVKSKGPIFGTQLGFNKQIGSAILGVETDFAFLMVDNNVEDDRVTVDYPCCAGRTFTIEHSLDTDWLVTVRPRAGIAAGPCFVYGTGGLAFTNVEFSSLFTDTLASAHADAMLSENRTGWTLGAGFEGRMGRKGSYKVEYLYADFGSMEVSTDNLRVADLPIHTEVFRYGLDLRMQMVRVGVNYRF